MKHSLLGSSALLALAVSPAPLVHAQTLLFQVPGIGEEFLGDSIAFVGDLDGDGVSDFAAGASQYQQFPGRVRLRSGADGSAIRDLANPEFVGDLGTSVAAVGDVDLDGIPDVLVGARFGNLTDTQGMAYVFSGASGSIVYALVGPFQYSNFGFAVAGLGDVNGDGRPDFAVSAPGIETDPLHASVHAYSGLDGSPLWSVAEGIGNENAFGWTLAAIDDLDGDGARDLLVGAPWSGPNDTGAAYAYSGASGARLFRFRTGTDSARIGASLAGTEDLDGDSIPDWLVSNYGSVELRSGADTSLIERWDGYDLCTFAGDVDRDGVGDVWLASRSTTALALVSGATKSIVTVSQQSSRTWRIAGGADVTGDGAPDLLRSVPWSVDPAGEVSAWSFGCSQTPIANYCTSSPNSAGAGAVMGSAGSTSVNANELALETSGCPPHQLGLYIYGPQESNLPFGDGVRCIAAPIFRLGPPVSTGAGTALRALDLDALPPNAPPITAGSLWRFQLWYRDPGFGAFGFNLSDGLSVEFCP